MKESIINGEIVLKYPDGFRPMDHEELVRYFGTANNMAGIRSPEQHILLSVAWNKVNMLLSMLADPNSVVNGMDKKLRGKLRDYQRTSDITMDVCGAKAKGFTFVYTAQDADTVQTGNILSFKQGKCFYVIQYAARKEDEQEAQNIFDKIIASLTLSHH